jgi:hypothetical protein
MNNRICCPSHCCVYHGCKYGYEDCPVVTGAVPQEGSCYDCPNLHWKGAEPRFEAKVGPKTLVLEVLEGGYCASFLGDTKDITGDLEYAKAMAGIFAVQIVEGMSRDLHRDYY